MNKLRRRVEGQRNQLGSVVDAIAEALGLFGGIVQTDNDANKRRHRDSQYAKSEFRVRLSELFSDEGFDSEQISGIRTNLVRVADQLIRLLAETAERASVKKELEVARAVQSLLVPLEDVIESALSPHRRALPACSECGAAGGVYNLEWRDDPHTSSATQRGTASPRQSSRAQRRPRATSLATSRRAACLRASCSR